MKKSHVSALVTSLGVLACASIGNAGAGHTSRTYFDRPGLGPFQIAPKYKNPWAGKVLGVPFCHTDDEKYERFLKKYQIAQAQHMVRVDRLNWKAYENHLDPPYSLDRFIGRCDCRGLTHDRGRGCQHCGARGCGERGCHAADKTCHARRCGHCQKCDTCGGRDHTAGCRHSGCRHDRCAGGRCPGWHDPAQRLGHGYTEYPPMNREDAHRYIEGFQYYPPYHMLRSPRDFYMWDVTHGLGR